MEPMGSHKREIESEASGMERKVVSCTGSLLGRRTPDPAEAGEGITLNHFA